MLIKIGFCLILLFVHNAAAQPPATSLSGKISKFYGEVVPGTVITLKSSSGKNRFRRTALSDNAGNYLFTGIPPGSYQISIADSNGLTYENPNFNVSANQPARLDIKLEYGGDCSNSGGNPLVLSEPDKAGIVNDILREVLLKGNIAESGRLKSQRAGIILSSENIEAEWLRPLKNIKISLLSIVEIRQKAEGSGEFLYLSFHAFRTKGNCVIAAVNNLWAAPINSRKSPVTGGGRIFIYHKKGNKVRLKTSGRWEF